MVVAVVVIEGVVVIVSVAPPIGGVTVLLEYTLFVVALLVVVGSEYIIGSVDDELSSYTTELGSSLYTEVSLLGVFGLFISSVGFTQPVFNNVNAIAGIIILLYIILIFLFTFLLL